MEKDNFIEFLDSYKNKNNINYFDFVHILNASHVHWMNSTEHCRGVYNSVPSPPLPQPQPNFHMSPDLSSSDIFHYWQPMYMSRINNPEDGMYSHPNPYRETPMSLSIRPYNTQDKQSHEFSEKGNIRHDLGAGVNDDRFVPHAPENQKPAHIREESETRSIGAPIQYDGDAKNRRHIDIEFSVDTIQDLIHLIDAHPILPNTVYNIDLQGLHNIRKELVELNEMVGIKSLKNSILNQLIYFIQEPVLNDNIKGYKHTVLCGPPGTGKTEIAKIIGQMYAKLGILKNSTFKKVTRNDLIAGYLGQTAIKTKEVIDKCLGGCLFIDEAYSLGHSSQNDSFSKECLDTLCEALSDHKDDLMVIIAGYENELEECFFGLNVGLKSRFIWKFKIDEYNAKELCQIFEKKIAESKWKISMLSENLLPWFESKKQEFKNYGRDIEQLLYYTKICHSRRIYGKSVDLAKKITMEDLDKGFQSFIENQSDKKLMVQSHYGLYV